jgi:serralysin
MLRRTVGAALAILVAAAISAVPVQTAGGSEDPPGTNTGPPYTYTTELVGQFGFLPLRNKGQLTKSEHGYRFRTGNQLDHLVVTLVDGKLRFVDSGNVDSWRKLSPACHRQHVRKGIAAVCPVPGTITVRRPLLIELWPRGGNDFTDTSSLPATFATTVLSDSGDDVAHFGAGPDFFNGFLGRDMVWGGAGNDWIRTGDGHDVVLGGAGNDDLVAGDGPDRMRGGDGDDRVWGGVGGDRLFGNAGADLVACNEGRDYAQVDRDDRGFQDCESIDHS